jgi:hypothetical protein
MTRPSTPFPRPRGGTHPPLGESLAAPCHTLVTRAGERLAWYGDDTGSGRPLVLVPSINAAPSSFEVKPLFDLYRGRRQVFSLDLPVSVAAHPHWRYERLAPHLVYPTGSACRRWPRCWIASGRGRRPGVDGAGTA